MRLAFAAALFSLFALAASPAARADTAGFLIGTNLARLSTNPDIGASTDSNFMMGGFAEFQVSPEFFIEPQLRYIEKGADLSNSGIYGSSVNVSRTLRYFELPLHFKYKFRDGEALRPYVFAGPALAFKVGDSTKITSNNGGSANLVAANDDGIQSMDFSADFGGGLELFFSETFSIRFGAEYSIGLMDINETVANWHTRGLQLYAGAGFEF